MKKTTINQYIMLYLIADMVPKTKEAIKAAKSLDLELTYELKKEELLGFVFENCKEIEQNPVGYALAGNYILHRVNQALGVTMAVECYKEGLYIAALNVLRQHKCIPTAALILLPIILEMDGEQGAAKRTINNVLTAKIQHTEAMPEIKEYFGELLLPIKDEEQEQKEEEPPAPSEQTEQ